MTLQDEEICFIDNFINIERAIVVFGVFAENIRFPDSHFKTKISFQKRF